MDTCDLTGLGRLSSLHLRARALCWTLRLHWELEKLIHDYTAWWLSSLASLVTVHGHCKSPLGFELILTRYGVPVLSAAPRIILPQHTRVVLPLLPNISIWLETSCVLCKSVVRWLFRELLLKVCILGPIWVGILQGFATSGCAGNEWKSPGDGIENLHLDS